MTTVYWSPLGTKAKTNPIEELSILFEEPKPLMKELATKYKDFLFMKCPALQASCKNTFVVTAPMDTTIHFSKNAEGVPTMFMEGFGWSQELFDLHCTIREDNSVSVIPSYVFYAKESVEMEVLPVFLLDSPSLENALFIAGSFNIGKWIRSIDFSFIPKDKLKPVVIKRGDPLFFIRFRAADEKITFERVEQSQELFSMINACTSLKTRVKNISLTELYKLAKSCIDVFLKRKNP
jgi:hypothetical protein